MKSQLDWLEVRDALAEAIKEAFPIQVLRAPDDRIAGVGLYIDICYGQVALNLLPESALSKADVAVNDLTSWPISTDWGLGEGHTEAFQLHWGRWDKWFSDLAGSLSDPGADPVLRGLLRVACEAMQVADVTGVFKATAKSETFRVVIHEEGGPFEMAVERYRLFVGSGVVRSIYDAPVC